MSCPICSDTRWKSIEIDGVERVVRCDCWQVAMLDRLIVAAGIPVGYNHCELENFDDRGEPTLQDALAKAMRFVRLYPTKETKGLFFLGPPGVGKTHLSVAVLKAAIRKTATTGYFFKTAELLQQIRNSYNKSVEDTEMGILEPIFNADVLVLDDVGVERPTDWVQEMLGILIDKRYSNHKATILTGNLNDATKHPAFFDSVQFKLGPRTRSRLLEMCDWIFIESHDMREVGKDPTKQQLDKFKERVNDLRAQSGGEGTKGMAKARLRPTGPLDLKWSGGKAGS